MAKRMSKEGKRLSAATSKVIRHVEACALGCNTLESSANCSFGTALEAQMKMLLMGWSSALNKKTRP
jgi:hypothetical protein